MRSRSRGRRAEKEQKMAAAVAAAVSEGGAKMAEAGALAGGGMAAANGAGNGVGEGVPKSESERPTQNEKRKEKSAKRGGGSRFEPYASPSKRYRAFITNIPFDVKWQYLKDLVKEKVGEVTYVELLMDAEGKSRVSLRENFFRGFLLHDQKKNNDKKINNVTVNGVEPNELGMRSVYGFIVGAAPELLGVGWEEVNMGHVRRSSNSLLPSFGVWLYDLRMGPCVLSLLVHERPNP
ncbi:uncharacterized protein LOC128405721 [Podarcis raffonei]|uniref:uncharacterized protein LOC128405721 n=1 Tax=Podarcis raffonei TaxID=65483 RepID=UPI00232979C8|nr:uncharacterized protein LOC128405721 [Podarcis raffonei]